MSHHRCVCELRIKFWFTDRNIFSRFRFLLEFSHFPTRFDCKQRPHQQKSKYYKLNLYWIGWVLYSTRRWKNVRRESDSARMLDLQFSPFEKAVNKAKPQFRVLARNLLCKKEERFICSHRIWQSSCLIDSNHKNVYSIKQIKWKGQRT